MNYFDNYVYNAIVNHSYQEHKKSITENDLINEIICQNYKKNKEQSRNDILKNYFLMLIALKYVNK